MGNAVINEDTDDQGRYDYFWSHAFTSDDAIVGIRKYCNFSLPDMGADGSRACHDALVEAQKIFSDPLDLYSVYAHVCASERVTAVPKPASIVDFDPCTDYYVEPYLNLAEVQAALQANVTKLGHP